MNLISYLASFFILLAAIGSKADPISIFIEALERDNELNLSHGEKGRIKNELEKGRFPYKNRGLKIIPIEIGNLANLTFINIAENNIQKIPKEIGNLINLDTISLEGTKIKELPSEFWKLKNLKHLSLRKNEFNYIPPEIGELTNLESLDLRNNRLTDAPIEIGNLTKIKDLFLLHNPILERGEYEGRWGKEELKRRFEGQIRRLQIDD